MPRRGRLICIDGNQRLGEDIKKTSSDVSNKGSVRHRSCEPIDASRPTSMSILGREYFGDDFPEITQELVMLSNVWRADTEMNGVGLLQRVERPTAGRHAFSNPEDIEVIGIEGNNG